MLIFIKLFIKNIKLFLSFIKEQIKARAKSTIKRY